ncbi:phosphonoacetaldehyde reductase [Ruminococcaceae bacterium OttesenSCG-928-L11]|nr:phosphonoacetaldehyde reductase [Ruminococcaceae bacterium OttesenSCG-928-L11]
MLDHIRYMDWNGFLSALAELSSEPVAILLDRSLAKLWEIASVLEAEKFNNWIWVDQIPPNPTEETIVYAVRCLKGKSVCAIIAVGGGSSIDLAKGMSALHCQEDILSSIQCKSYLEQGDSRIPIIAVPTTAGTGSEVTQWATVWGAHDNRKYSIDVSWLTPTQVWLVPELAKSLPPRITLSTGFDALSHAMEAYWAKASNPLVKALSVRSLEMILQYLPKALSHPEEVEFRQSMLTASLMAGFAFSQTRTTACHSISYPMTALFGVDHGLAVCMTLAAVAKINSDSVDCSEIFALFAPLGGIQHWLDMQADGIVHLRLASFGITKLDIARIVENAFTNGRIDNNPVSITEDMVTAVLEDIYE